MNEGHGRLGAKEELHGGVLVAFALEERSLGVLLAEAHVDESQHLGIGLRTSVEIAGHHPGAYTAAGGAVFGQGVAVGPEPRGAVKPRLVLQVHVGHLRSVSRQTH